jgi:rubrerythrin
MALTTFGAIMGFAAEMSVKAEAIYKNMVQKGKDPKLRGTFEAFAAEEGKNHAVIVKARRENVTEMILEPVSGFQSEDYEINLMVLDSMPDTELLKAARILEEKGKRFFADASSKVPLPEVSRIFRKLAHKKEENLIKLKNLG